MKILIVDDEPGLAARLAQELAGTGVAEVESATNAEEAVELITRTKTIEVLVTDVIMEGTDGFTLRETLEPQFPGMPTIFMTEYDLSDYADRIGGRTVLTKPVDVAALAAAIAAVQPVAEQRDEAESTPSAVAAPRATPKVVTTAQPKVVPAVASPSQPKAVPTAAAGPKVSATPRATPAAVPTAAVVAATPKAVPAPSPSPVAASASPKAVPAAAPKAAVAAKATPVKAAAVKAGVSAAAVPAVAARPVQDPSVMKDFTPREDELEPDDLVGRAIGDYQVEAKIAEHSLGGIYRAVQTSMGRPVRLYVLGAEFAGERASVERFLANASVKANVRHPAVLAVFEAGERDGIYYYACEYVPSTSMADVAARGLKLDPVVALKVVQTTADVMAYFGREKILHEPLKPTMVLLDGKGGPRVANVAAHEPSRLVESPDEIRALAGWVIPLVAATPEGARVGELLETASQPEGPLRSWPALAQESKNRLPQVAPADAYKLDARERAAIKAVEDAKRRQKRSVIISSLVSLGLLATALAVVYFMLVREPTAKTFDRMIAIPAGAFIYQDGEKVELPQFWIDEHEVTIGQYAQFLEWVEANPEEAAKLVHPDQPGGKSHVPEGWADEDLATGPMPGYYTRAKKWGKFQGVPLDINSPVFGVDWFDAYAYAAWVGRRLPTEQEWEKAARGADGLKYPWGNELDPRLVNSGADIKEDPTKGGDIDGFIRGAPVDAIKGDRSPYGVMGMGGNMSEWTATWAESPDIGEKVPVIRGGNWFNPDVSATRRMLVLFPFQNDKSLGFRTASDVEPTKK